MVVIVSVAAAVFVVVGTLVAKPRLEQLAARREQIGDTEVPARQVYRTIAVSVLGAAVGIGVIALGDYRDTAFVIGMVIVGMTLASTVIPSIRDAETAQRRKAESSPVDNTR